MGFAIKELLVDKLEVLKAHQLSNIESLSNYVQEVSEVYFDPRTAPAHVVTVLNELASKAYEELELLKPWVEDCPLLASFTESVEEAIECVINKFWSWSDRVINDVKAAAALYGKSRSTIYRWIKQGKLSAKKEKGRWQVIQ